MVGFTCRMDGKCCRIYWVPVTHLDVFRIVYYGDFKPEEFLKPHEGPSSSIPSIKTRRREYCLALRQDMNKCVFLLDNGKCSIHEFKPLTCRFYPFVYVTRNGKAIDIDVYSKALGKCPGLVMDKNPINTSLRNQLLRLANIRLIEIKLYHEAISNLLYEFNSNPSIQETIDFLVDKAKKDYYKLRANKLWVK